MRDILIEFLNTLRDYLHESKNDLSENDRDSSEFVDIFLSENPEYKDLKVIKDRRNK